VNLFVCSFPAGRFIVTSFQGKEARVVVGRGKVKIKGIRKKKEKREDPVEGWVGK
jgi:hypothetical protein